MSDEKDIDIQNQGSQEMVDITELINPFPGLRPFGIEESHLFFGREGQSDEVLVKLSENRFISILGSSGSGKSSLMFCGLIPTLFGGFMTDAGSHWKIVVTRPGGGPIDNLAEALLLQDKEYSNLQEEDKLIRKTIISTVLRSSSLGLVEVIRQLKSADYQNILILVDQFEELFRFRKLEAATSDLDESSAFVNLLLEAVHQFDEPIYVALTMRSDFIGDCAQYPDLTQMINDSHYLIPQMTRDQKRVAIEGPVAVGGGQIAPRLTQQLLNDVGDSPDQLPILQHALMRTWAFWTDNRKQGEVMDLRHYNAIGTLREALSMHANEAFDALSKREQEICETMFKALTERGNENQGIRRPTKLSTMAAIAGVNEDELTRVVERFREPGRSLLMPPYGVKLDSETVIDISHESLMRIWIRLKRWLDEESKAAEMYLKLSEAAERYQEGKAGLWQMPDLQLALNWREENRPTLVWGQRYNPAYERTLVFLETSEKAYLTEQRNKELLQKRQVRRMRLFVIVMAAMSLVSIFFVVFANVQSKYADEARADAEKLADEAVELKERAQVEATNARKAQADAVLAQEAAEEAAIRADREAANARAAQADAEIQKNNALAAEADAQEQARIAKEAQALAQEQTEKAEAANIEANRLKYQSLATSMAIKSLNVNNDDNLKGLVARQAFDFYEEFKDEGKEYNGDIYAGVYGAYSQLTEIGEGDSLLRFNHYQGHLDAVRSVRHSVDGKTLYSAGSDGKVLKWSIARKTSQILFESDDIQRVVNVSPDERYLAMGTDNSHILLFDLRANTGLPKKIEGHVGGTVYDMVFLPDGRGFISSGEDRRILKSNFNTSVEILKVNSSVKALAVSPDGKTLACGAANGEVYLVDLSSPDYVTTKIWLKDAKPVEALAFSQTGDQLAFGENNGNIIIWDLNNKKKFGPTLTGFVAAITDVEFSPDSRLLAASSRDKSVRFWDLENIYDLPTVLDDHNGWVWSISFNPDGDRIMTGCQDGLVRNFPLKSSEMAFKINENIEAVNGGKNLSETEWKQYVALETVIPYEETIKGEPRRLDE
ncbi:MAG: WD40 repeat domain-containing protein [Cytophagales bacterium]|nr:WD40 repeat domain-containing protein [Cytophagales bacterium]